MQQICLIWIKRPARPRAGESLTSAFNASSGVHYVITGSGTSEVAGEHITWHPGVVFVTPGGIEVVHTASNEAAVLWVVGNDPRLNFENLQAPAPGNAPTSVVHYTSGEIDHQIKLIYDIGRDNDIAGSALIFSSDTQQESRNVLPTLTLAMNSLPAGAVQRPHRHNSVAVSLVIRGDKCFSVIDGARKDWVPWATTITPPVSVHSHHNDGDEQAMFLIVQDGGLFYHARAMAFEFVDD